MMNREDYAEVKRLWEDEKNFSRLAYRIVKLNDRYPEFSEIVGMAQKITGMGKKFEEMLQGAKAVAYQWVQDRLEQTGCTDIKIKDYEATYKKDGKSYFTLIRFEDHEEYREYQKSVREFTDKVEAGLDLVMSNGYVKSERVCTYNGPRHKYYKVIHTAVK